MRCVRVLTLLKLSSMSRFSTRAPRSRLTNENHMCVRFLTLLNLSCMSRFSERSAKIPANQRKPWRVCACLHIVENYLQCQGFTTRAPRSSSWGWTTRERPPSCTCSRRTGCRCTSPRYTRTRTSSSWGRCVRVRVFAIGINRACITG